MKVISSSECVVLEIDDEGTRKFEAFLDRNCGDWRLREMFKEHNAGTVRRRWRLGVDDMERGAIYRGRYVEIYDECFEQGGDADVTIHFTPGTLCDIDGDLSPVARCKD